MNMATNRSAINTVYSVSNDVASDKDTPVEAMHVTTLDGELLPNSRSLIVALGMFE